MGVRNRREEAARVGVRVEEVRPLGDCVLVEHLPLKERDGEIVLPESARAGATYTFGQGYVFRGRVVAVGPGANYVERLRKGNGVSREHWVKRSLSVVVAPSVKVGDEVLFERRSEAEFVLGGVVHTMLHEEQSILGVVEE